MNTDTGGNVPFMLPAYRNTLRCMRVWAASTTSPLLPAASPGAKSMYSSMEGDFCLQVQSWWGDRKICLNVKVGRWRERDKTEVHNAVPVRILLWQTGKQVYWVTYLFGFFFLPTDFTRQGAFLRYMLCVFCLFSCILQSQHSKRSAFVSRHFCIFN